MAGSPGGEGEKPNKRHAREDDEEVSDIFEYQGSGDEVLMGQIRKRSKVCLCASYLPTQTLIQILLRLSC